MSSERLDEALRFFQEATAAESCRGLVLVSAEQVNAALGEMLRAVLVQEKEAKDAPQIEDALGRGFLRYIDARLKAAYLFGLMYPATFLHVDALRRLRNEVAHSRNPFDLGTPSPKVQRYIDGLVPHGGIVQPTSDLRERNRLRVWATGYLGCLWIDIAHRVFEESGRLGAGQLSYFVTKARAAILVEALRRPREASVAKTLLGALASELHEGDVPPDRGASE